VKENLLMSDFNIGFVIFPGITQLDFTGPFEVLSRLGTPPSLSIPSKFPQSKTHVVAKTLLPVLSDRGLGIMPTCTFQSCPPLNMICVPGGAGVVEALADVETIDFIRTQGARADYVTSVCMGAFLLGAAGAASLRESTLHSTSLPNLPNRRSREPSSLELNTTRLLRLMPVIPTRHRRRPRPS
jgi:cyclohexyl-isocyanide hydratase